MGRCGWRDREPWLDHWALEYEAMSDGTVRRSMKGLLSQYADRVLNTVRYAEKESCNPAYLKSLQEKENETEREIIEQFDALRTQARGLAQELRNIANADTRDWDDPTDFKAWAQNRARHALQRAQAVMKEGR